jgi:hydrogenase maturation protease
MKIKDLLHELKEYSQPEIIFIGLGNEYRNDDGAGLVFIDRLINSSYFINSHFIRAGANPENYLQQILNTDGRIIIFIDAIFGTLNEESIFFLSPEEIDTLRISTHSFSLKLIEKFLLFEKIYDFKYLCIKGYEKEIGNNLSFELQISLDDFFGKTVEIKS